MNPIPTEAFSKHVKTVIKNLNQHWANVYVKANNDVFFFKQKWEGFFELQDSSWYKGSFIPSWESVEKIVEENYHNKLLTYKNIGIDDRVNSILYLNQAITKYLHNAMKGIEQEVLPTFLEKYNFE